VVTDFNPLQGLAEMRDLLLGELMSEAMGGRLLDGASRADVLQGSLTLAEMQSRLNAALWSDLKPGIAIDPARRALQRTHVTLLAQWLMAPASIGRAELRLQMQQQARTLLARLDKVPYGSIGSPETAAHLKDSAQRLRDVLQARVVRPGA
jgi:hypothetical protein